ncbi:hypothetical protein GCM10027347_56920 [Larkinella harenae]
MVCFLFPILLAAFSSYQQPASRAHNQAPESITSQQPALFQFPTFKEGVVIFRNSSKRTARLNYNFLHGKLQFIDEHTDTLLLTNKYLIRRVLIDDKEFIIGAGDEDHDLETVGVYSLVRIAKLAKWVPKAYSTSASSQQFKSSVSSPIPSSLLITNQAGEFQWQNTTLPFEGQLKTTFYFIDRNENRHPASQKAIEKLYPRLRAEVRAYTKIHRVNYSDLGAIQELLAQLDATS